MNRKRKFKVSKKEDEWKFSKWDGPPYSYSVKVNGKKGRQVEKDYRNCNE
jgi:hypothetical protein